MQVPPAGPPAEARAPAILAGPARGIGQQAGPGWKIKFHGLNIGYAKDIYYLICQTNRHKRSF
jgi:hypothetical protein